MNNNQTGTTLSEEYLAKLGKHAFLSAWRYMNPYTNEGPQGRELCDMFVVFGENVLIFSVKDIKFNYEKSIETAWHRWYREAIDKSVAQIFGAEKMVLRHPERIFLDAACKNKFPFPLNPNNIKIHRICVALGIGNACAKFYGEKENVSSLRLNYGEKENVSSLRLNFGLNGVQQHKRPFTIGHPCLEKGFVHIFDDFTLDTVFKEVDTITDFVDYLNKRENFLAQTNLTIMAAGEEELLAVYLINIKERGECDFPLNSKQSDHDLFIIDQGHWEGLISNEQYIAKKKADKISYRWDVLIEKFIEHGEVHDLDGNYFPKSLARDAPRFKYMAEESRFARRGLIQAILGVLKSDRLKQAKVRTTPPATRVVLPLGLCNKAYVFLVMPWGNNINYNDYRKTRQAELIRRCVAVKLKYPDRKCVVGIAMGSFSCKGANEDFFILEENDWTPKMKKWAQEMQRMNPVLENVSCRKINAKEYPK